MKLNPETLRAVGNALYGPKWLYPLSEALGVHERTMRRWRDDQFTIPNGIWDELTTLCRTHGAELFHLSSELKKAPRLD